MVGIIKYFNISGILERLSNKWTGRQFPDFYNFFNADAILRKNIKLSIKSLLDVASDINEIEIIECIDSTTPSIRLISSRNQTITLWLDSYKNGRYKINSITPY